MKRIIIITGHPGAGKNTLGKQLSERYKLLFISKDALKERMFDALGTHDKEWSLKVSAAAHRIMDDLIRAQFALNQGIIVESNFKKDIDSERFARIIEKSGATCIQVLCEANGDILFKRWMKRIEEGERHEGHVERVSLDQIKVDLSQPYLPLELPGTLVRIDTSDFSTIDNQLEIRGIA